MVVISVAWSLSRRVSRDQLARGSARIRGDKEEGTERWRSLRRQPMAEVVLHDPRGLASSVSGLALRPSAPCVPGYTLEARLLSVFYLAAAALLILINAFFVASEFALVKIRPTRLEQLIKQGNRQAKLALRMSQQLDAYLSANQLGITLASLALGWIGEPAIAGLVQPLLAAIGPRAALASHGIAIVISFALITSLHTIIGELAPKSLAIQLTEKVALATALPLHIFFLMMWPLIWLLNTAANGFVRLFGLHPAHEHEMAHTSDELRLLLTRRPAGLDPSLRSMLVRIFDLRRRTARHVMTLRNDAATLREDMTFTDAVKIANDAGYSRYPVLDAASTRVKGYVHLRDLFAAVTGHRKAQRILELARQPLFALESTSVERLRLEMQAKQRPLAVITAASGEFVGIVTIEDLLEEIVGEIRDENDEELAPILRHTGGALDVEGRLLLTDLERDAGVTLRPEAKGAETVAGYILDRLTRPAKQGERVACEGYTLIASDVAIRRIRRVRIIPEAPKMIQPLEAPPLPAEAEAAP
jgi:CBS domain containing-hemolysin-like protein